MSDIYHINDEYSNSAFRQQRFMPDSATSLGSYLIAVLIGVYVLFKSLELLGYPVWLWLHQLIKMAADSLPVKVPLLLTAPPSDNSFADPDAEAEPQDSDPQSEGGSMFGSLFGLGSGGILGKGMGAVSGALSKSYRNVPAGLGNWDNSCYQNSVIQGMASLPSLRDYLSKTTAEHKALDTESTSGALFDLVNKLNNPENHGQHFWIRGKLKSMSTFQQQDAQEYYSKILDALDKEAQNASNSKRRSSASLLLNASGLNDLPVTVAGQEESAIEDQKENSPTPPEQLQVVPNPLDGLLAQRVGCVNCGYTEGLSLIPFNCITVPLGRDWNYDIRACLDEYTSLELIEGVECAKCTVLRMKNAMDRMKDKIQAGSPLDARLHALTEVLEEEDYDDKTIKNKLNVLKKNWVQTTKSRQAVIARAPKSLVLHVNRSIFDEMTGAQYKNNANVMYPKVLDLGTWCLGSRPSESQKPDDSIEEAWPRDPTKSMLGEDTEPSTDSPFQYALRAVITHAGSHGNGHYICYRQHPFKAADTEEGNGDEKNDVEKDDEEEKERKTSHEQWWRLSDESVREAEEEEALRQRNVFMLFYERIDADSNPLPPSETEYVASSTAVAADDIPLPPTEVKASEPDVTLLAEAAATAVAVPLLTDGFDSLPPSPPASPRLPLLRATTPIIPSESQVAPSDKAADAAAIPSPPSDTPETSPHEDTEVSEAETTNYDSDDAPSTLLTSDDDAEASEEPLKESSEVQQNSLHGPQRMRTAGDVGTGRDRTSLPMVTAT